jgi:DNA-binding MarR family transcriptional regulator
LTEPEPIARLIAGARRRLRQAVGRRVRALGLSPQQFWLLVNLEAGSCLRSLASRLHMDEPTASRIVAGLRRRRLVSTRADPHDRRRLELGLTQQGADLARRLRPVAEEVRRTVEDGFTTEEKDHLRRLLGRVVENTRRLEARGGETRRHP